MAGLALLTAAPLLSATSSITFTLCEDTFIRPLLSQPNPNLRRQANRILPSATHFTRRGLLIVFTTYPLSMATAIANLSRHDAAVDILNSSSLYNKPRLAAGFFLAGLIFSVLHFPLGPKAMGYLDNVRDDKGVEGDLGRDNTALVGKWLRLNWIRGVVADVPSWVCYFAAFLCAMS